MLSLRGGRRPTWQSQGNNGWEISDERYFPEIAAALAGPRNDRCSRRSAPGLRFPLSLRGPLGPWQSVFLQAVIFRKVVPFPPARVLVTALRSGTACTRAAKGRPYGAPSNFAVIARAVRPVVICPPTVSLRGAKRRGNLKAPMDGKLRLNGTSQRLPRPLRGLAMTSFGVASGGVWRAFA